jgi:hypothetical protein
MRLLVGALILLGLTACACRQSIHERVERLTRHLATAAIHRTSPDDPDIVLAAPWLEELDDLREGYKVRITHRDYFNEPERVTHNVYVSTERWERGIRLRYDPNRDKFHMVGYWTIRRPEGDDAG